MRATTPSPSDSATLSGARGGAFAFLRDAWRGIQLGREMRAAEGPSNITEPQQWLIDAITGGPSKSGAKVSENTAFNVSAVRACVNLRANLLAMLPLKVYKKTGLGSEEQRDHPLARLFRGRVSPSQTRFKWVKCTQVCFDMGGNGYGRIYRNAYAEPERIQFKLPAKVTPLHNERSGDVGFRVQGEDRDLFQYEVLHVCDISTNGLTGRSPLADLREAIGLAITAEEFTARTFSNGNRKPGFFIPPASWKQAQADAFKLAWQQQAAGAVNAGKQHLIGGGMTWTEAGFSNEDAELLMSRKFSIEEIARVYQIPLHLIGSTEKATTWGSGIEQLNRGLVDYTLQPICTNWEAEMNTTLLTEREQDEEYFIKFNVDAFLRGSPEARAKFYQVMRGIAAMSVNEVRSREEMTRLEMPDGIFDDVRLPLNNQGGGGANNPDTQKVPAGGEDDNA